MTTIPTDSLRSDFDANHHGDILWRDHSGNNVLWLMNNNTFSAVAPLPFVTPDWHFKAAAEFDPGGVGNADILWQNDNGALALWQMQGTTVTAIHALPNPGPTWHVVGDNDFSGDAIDDILFRHDSGVLALWTISSAATGMISGAFTCTQNPGPTWHVVGTGDADGDGKADILWRHDSGALVLWEDIVDAPPEGFTFSTVAALPSVDPSWHVKGMADVSGDGKADIVFQHDSGAVVVWEMGAFGTTIAAANLVNLNPGPAWHIVGLRNMDGDTKADILLQNDNGAAAVWEDYLPVGGGSATFNAVLLITPNPNPNGHVWDLL